MHSNQIKLIARFFIIGLVIFAIPVFVFIIHFKHQGISNDTNDWATFSNYLNGLLTPFFTLVNTIALIYLTFEVAKRNSSQHNEALEHQRRLHEEQLLNQQKILEKESKYSALKEFMVLSSNIHKSLIDFEQPGIKLLIYSIELMSIATLNKTMFKTLQNWDRVKNISKQLADLSNTIRDLFKKIDFNSDNIDLQEKINNLINGFNSLLVDMQQELYDPFKS